MKDTTRVFMNDWRNGKVIEISVEDYEQNQGAPSLKETAGKLELVGVAFDTVVADYDVVGNIRLPNWDTWYKCGLYNTICDEGAVRFFSIDIDLYDKLSSEGKYNLRNQLEMGNYMIEYSYLDYPVVYSPYERTKHTTYHKPANAGLDYKYKEFSHETDNVDKGYRS